MLRCLEQLIPSIFSKEEAMKKKKQIFPEDDLEALMNNPERYREIRDTVNQTLGIAPSLPE
jgi:malate dehydrogenase (quinone)